MAAMSCVAQGSVRDDETFVLGRGAWLDGNLALRMLYEQNDREVRPSGLLVVGLWADYAFAR